MYIGLHVKYRYSFHNLLKVEFSRQIFEKYLNFTNIRQVGAELFHADGQTHRQAKERTGRQTESHDEANSRFSQFCEHA
jgi:hypothetical protein